MDYKEKYEMALETIQEILDSGSDSIKMSRLRLRLQSVFPELCEPEDERIRKELLEHCKSQAEPYILTGNKCPQIQSWISWLEKQGEVESDNDDIEVEEKGIREAFNKIEDEKQCKQKPFDYKNQGTQNSHKFNIGDIISNGNVEFRIDNIVKNCVGQDCYFLVDVESEKNGTRYLTMCVGGKTSHMGETTWLCEQVDKSFKKQGEQKPITEMKSAEESLGVDSDAYNEIVDECIYGEQKSQRMISAEAKEAMYDKPADKVEPKFKVKYAGSEYNVLEIKDIAGVAFYGIEDEPNHIDYVKAENCEIIDGYAIKENGSPYPTKSAVFFGAKNSTWSKEDDVMIYKLLAVVELYYDRDGDDLDKQSCIDWLKALKQRCAWKPSDEQLEALKNAIHIKPFKNPSDSILWRLYEQLKKLREE